MAYSNALTQEGRKFIYEVCKGTGTKFISGNNGIMPYTNPFINKTWTSQATYNGSLITSGEQLGDALIYWFNLYAEMFKLDANVVAAQAYAESGYKIWIYVAYIKDNSWQSTASGINQFLMSTFFGTVIDNAYGAFTADEIAKFTKNLVHPEDKNSYRVGGKTIGPPAPNYQNGWTNRPILHQNIIDNPDLMIKAQCAYLNYISNLCKTFTSSTLFCYSRGEGFAKNTYLDTINACKNSKLNKDGTYIKEGLKYVQSIFGILGDKNNLLASKGLGRGYKPIGYYFGYDDAYFTKNDPKNLKLFDTYNPYNTTLG